MTTTLTTTMTSMTTPFLAIDDLVNTMSSVGASALDIKATYYLSDTGKYDKACNLRNLMLLQFFGKFLYSSREFVICDHTGMSFHKSFKLIPPYRVR